MAKKIDIEDIDFDEFPYAMLGNEPVGPQPKGVWEIPKDAIVFFDKSPSSYYLTTGEAIKKTERLHEDIKLWKKQCMKLLRLLKKAKGENKYLETCWMENRYLIKIKNPRKKKDPEQK